MNLVKQVSLFGIVLANLAGATPSAIPLAGKYDIHLYFGEKGFIDELTLAVDGNGKITGQMHVPNDFDSPIEHFVSEGDKFTFDYLVPKNAFRPKDFHARYEGRFYDASHQEFIGFGTVIEDQTFMASFLGHRLKQD